MICGPGRALRITGRTSWRARVIQPDELPLMDDETTGRGEACFRRTPGAKRVTVQGARGGSMGFVPDCDCPGSCDESDAATESRTSPAILSIS